MEKFDACIYVFLNVSEVIRKCELSVMQVKDLFWYLNWSVDDTKWSWNESTSDINRKGGGSHIIQPLSTKAHYRPNRAEERDPEEGEVETGKVSGQSSD